MPSATLPPLEVVATPQPPSLDYYRVNNLRLTYLECWRLTYSWKVLVPGIAKLFRLPLTLVEGMATPRPFIENLVAPENLSPDTLAHLDKMRTECESLGFNDAIYYKPKQSFLPVEAGNCVLREPSGEAIAHLFYGRAQASGKSRRLVVCFYTALADGKLLITSNHRRGFTGPPGNDGVCRHGASAPVLYLEHRRRLQGHIRAGNPPVLVSTTEESSTLIWRLEQKSHEFLKARGLYEPMRGGEVEALFARKASSERVAADCSPAVTIEVNAVLTALAKRERPASTSAIAGIILLAVSLLAYVLVGRLRWRWDFVVLIVGTLFLHETGHYLAMRAFGYRNLRMFFIPFVGAAVSGVNSQAPGWQKALVSLAGPLPGIFLGAGLLLATPFLTADPLARQAAVVLLVVNGFNLLPLLPLDGGRFLNETIFARSAIAQAAFSCLAGVSAVALGATFSHVFLYIVGAFMIGGVGRILRVGRAVKIMRWQRVVLTEPATVPGQAEVVRPEALPPILSALKKDRPKIPAQPMLVNEALMVIDQLRARPPRLAATMGLLVLYGATCAMALWFLVPLAPSLSWQYYLPHSPQSLQRLHQQRVLTEHLRAEEARKKAGAKPEPDADADSEPLPPTNE